MLYKCGKLPKEDDARNLKLARYLKTASICPATCDWTSKVWNPGMMLNDQIGDCTCATTGHMEQTWTANDGIQVNISDADILAAYKAVSGYDGTPQTDNGAIVLDVLKHWQKVGVGGRKIGAYVEVDTKNLDEVKAAIWLFGGVYYGLDLPNSIDGQDTWSVPWYGARFSGRRGSLGGHAVSAHGYTGDIIKLITWGKIQPMTSKFATTYGDEAYAVLSEDWLGPDNKAPNFFDGATLLADLAEVTK